MKRYVRLAAGLSLSMGLLACSGSDSDEQSHELEGDAGVQDFADEIKGLRDRLNQLNPQLTMLDSRLDALEAPKVPGSCSAGELCIPDGIDLSRQGFQPIIAALCTKATTCCEARELNWLYGPAVKTEADCEAAFTQLINNAQSTSYTGVFAEHLDDIIRAAHALNDTNILVEIDGAAVTACAGQIGAEVCYRDQVYADGCTPNPSGEKDLCSLSLLLKGKEREGDTCEPGYFNECGAGLVCRGESNYYSPGQTGLCATKAVVGDRCLKQTDCDDLYCDASTGTCKVRSKEGEPCAYVDPTLLEVNPLDVDPFQTESAYGEGEITTIDCEPGFLCSPATNTCAKAECGPGSFCFANQDCPSGLVCTNSGSTVLQAYAQERSFLGVCAQAQADGSVCSFHSTVNNPENDCASGRCFDHDDNGSETCQPARMIANGQSCADVGHSSCASGFCNNGTCEAKVASGASCSTGYDQQCPAAEYCNDGTCADGADLGESCMSRGCAQGLACRQADPAASDYRCYKYDDATDYSADLPNGVSCYADKECTSGWCQAGDPSTCATPLPEGAECDLEYDDQCAAGLACLEDAASTTGYSCKKYKLPGEPCDPNLVECYGGRNQCQLHNDSFLCNPYSGNEPFCVDLGAS